MTSSVTVSTLKSPTRIWTGMVYELSVLCIVYCSDVDGRITWCRRDIEFGNYLLMNRFNAAPEFSSTVTHD